MISEKYFPLRILLIGRGGSLPSKRKDKEKNAKYFYGILHLFQSLSKKHLNGGVARKIEWINPFFKLTAILITEKILPLTKSEFMRLFLVT